MLKPLLITKPLIPPWDDAAKNLARDIVLAIPEMRFHVFTADTYRFDAKNAKSETVYSLPDPRSTGLWDKIKVFFRLLQPDELGLYHFFFAPNPMTSKMCSLALLKKGYQKSIQTICSQPETYDNIKKLLFADATVTVSQDTKSKLEQAGVKNVSCIYPAVKDNGVPTQDEIIANRKKFNLPENATIALFAGDLAFSNCADVLTDSFVKSLQNEKLHFVICTRIKSPKAKKTLAALKSFVSDNNWQSRVTFIPTQADLQPLLKCVDFQIMHPDTLYGKMDLPLVVLEGMSFEVPCIISNLPSLLEIFGHEEAGLVIKHSSSEQLSDAIIRMTKDTDERKAFGIAARRIVLEKFSLARLGEQYRALYKEFDK